MGMSLIANSESPTTARHNGEHSDGEWRMIDVPSARWFAHAT